MTQPTSDKFSKSQTSDMYCQLSQSNNHFFLKSQFTGIYRQMDFHFNTCNQTFPLLFYFLLTVSAVLVKCSICSSSYCPLQLKYWLSMCPAPISYSLHLFVSGILSFWAANTAQPGWDHSPSLRKEIRSPISFYDLYRSWSLWRDNQELQNCMQNWWKIHDILVV